MTENEAVRRAFEIAQEAIRQAKETDLGNDPKWAEEERDAIWECLDVIGEQLQALAVVADPR